VGALVALVCVLENLDVSPTENGVQGQLEARSGTLSLLVIRVFIIFYPIFLLSVFLGFSVRVMGVAD